MYMPGHDNKRWTMNTEQLSAVWGIGFNEDIILFHAQ